MHFKSMNLFTVVLKMDQEKQLWCLYPWGDFAEVKIVPKNSGATGPGQWLPLGWHV